MSVTRDDLGVWLINLPHNHARYQAMAQQLDQLGLGFTHFEAVNGKERQEELLLRADADAYARNMGSPLIPGKLGVYASHVGVWEAFLASDKDIALILEDDVVFHDDFLAALDVGLAHQEDWDLLRFNSVRAKMPIKQAQFGKYQMNAYLGPFTGNACYLLHRKTAEKLLGKIWPQTRAMDHELNRFFRHDYRQFGLEPWASHPDDGGNSTITGTNYSLVHKFKWYKRLPHYRLKAANYFRRFWWLLTHGCLTSGRGRK